MTVGADPGTIGELVRARATDGTGPRTALVLDDAPFTYREVDEHANRWANGLRRLGVGPGDVVAAFLPTRPELVWTWLGTSKLGAVVAPLNDALRGEFLRHPLELSGARVVVCAASLLDRLAAVSDRLSSVARVVVVDDGSPPPDGRPGDPATVDVVAAVDLVDGVGVEEPAPVAAPDDVAAVLSTGGTTGPSKGVAVSHRYLLHVSRATWEARGGDRSTVCYSPLPMFHLNTPTNTLLGSWLAGATAAVDARFSVSRFWDRVRAVGATQVCILGSMITMLWGRERRPDDADNPVEVLLGVPVPPDLHHAFEERFGLRIVTLYGLTEAVPITLASTSRPPRPGTSGRVVPGLEVRLVDDDGRVVAPGAPGEVVCRPRAPGLVFSGYWRDPAATRAAAPDGWLRTGDIGRFDGDDLVFVDRKTDSIRRRGENISSFEVERAVRRHPDVAEVAAHGVRAEHTEEDVKVCVVPRPGAALDPADLARHCDAEMPRYATPRYIEVLDALPTSPVGRVLKGVLRARGVGDAWDREAVADHEGLAKGPEHDYSDESQMTDQRER